MSKGFAGMLAFVLVLISSLVWAGPFLVCDPYPVDVQVQGFKGTVNGMPFDTPYALHPSGVPIVYDCAGLGPEKWDFVNIRAYNVRGESVGVPFVYPSIPGNPAGMRYLK